MKTNLTLYYTYRWLWWSQPSHEGDSSINAVVAQGFENSTNTLTHALKR